MMMVTTVVFFNSCKEGPVGEIGPKGETGDQGPTGATGADGAAGIDGENGYGYEEALESGYIALVLEGTRPDDVAFEDSLVFQFCPIEMVPYLSTYYYDELNDQYEFYLTRFIDNNQEVNLRSDPSTKIIQIGFVYDGENISVEGASYTEDAVTLVFDDYKIFSIDFYDNPLDYLEADGITNYSFDPETGKVTLKLDIVVPNTVNNTGNELHMVAYINAVVYKNLNPDK